MSTPNRKALIIVPKKLFNHQDITLAEKLVFAFDYTLCSRTLPTPFLLTR